MGHPRKDKLKPFFFDNTDPDGMNRTLAAIGKKLDRTLCIVISKSGGTKETRNGMLVAQAAYEKAGLNFGQHAVAVTMFGSELDKYTIANQWLERFPMWDWVGGRTSELSAVGLLPAALQGIDIAGLWPVASLRMWPPAGKTLKTIQQPNWHWLGMLQVTVKERKTWSFCRIKTVWNYFPSIFNNWSWNLLAKSGIWMAIW